MNGINENWIFEKKYFIEALKLCAIPMPSYKLRQAKHKINQTPPPRLKSGCNVSKFRKPSALNSWLLESADTTKTAG
ncbi:MAG: hypothetical protein EAY75_10095 [Bacteroidetes bacterium]|nr:MAG: hypothetical protein EAY75_10095 [Bacteroidota bacterium]